MILFLALASLMIASTSAGLFFKNLGSFTPLFNGGIAQPVSVLIPARNEESSIRDCLAAVLANSSPLEVIVLDDGSTDRTAELVNKYKNLDPRVRYEIAPPLPAGWCGKQHACFSLAKLATHDVFIFIDADVRLAADAVARCSIAVSESRSALISGFPREITGSFAESLLIPLIHFMLLGFLPVDRMRSSTSPAFGAGCGQLFIAKREAYFAAGGHSAIHASLHDGIKLPRAFREAGFSTDIFDATDLASCHMYHGTRETFFGLAKNATEGIASPAAIIPWTIVLFVGQILPWMFIFTPLRSPIFVLSLLAIGSSYAVRYVAVKRFQQSILGAILHPLGILSLLIIQWYALAKKVFGHPATWRGRSYV